MSITTVKNKRGTAAEWASANPILADGELGFERDTNVVKVGDGSKRWNQLKPVNNSVYTSAAQLRSAAGLFRAMVPTATRGMAPGSGILSNGTDTSGMYRWAHTLNTDTGDIRLVYANIYGAQGALLAAGPNPITVKATVEPPVGAPVAAMPASVYAVTFNGALTVTIQPGQVVISDPIPITGKVGQIVYSNTYVSVTAGQKWPLGQKGMINGLGLAVAPNLYEGGATGAPATDTTAGGSTPPTNYVQMYGPTVVIGTASTSATPRDPLLSWGDSILFGSHDYTEFYDGWLGRACIAATVSYINLSHPGEQASHVQGTGSALRLPLSEMCAVAVINYGRNDLANIAGISLATFQGYCINIWKSLAIRGVRVYHTTLTPITTSTDNYITTTNQTNVNTNSYETNRKAFNAWLRDGAPMTAALAPVATGSNATGTIRVGATGHPLRGYIEVADVMETARDSGIFRQGRVVTDAAFTSGTRNIVATANFTAADIGHAVYVPGVGYARIATVTDPTHATYEGANVAASNLSAQTIGIGYYTDDGTHPTTTGHIAIAATVNAAAL